MCVEKGHFLQLGANVLVEFKNVILMGGIFLLLGAIRGKYVSGIKFFLFFQLGGFFSPIGGKFVSGI